jgi:hypothetical protein
MAKSISQIIPAIDVTYTGHGHSTVQDALDSLLRLPPTINSFTITSTVGGTGGTVNEKGQTVTIVNTAFSYSGDTPTHSSLTDVPGFDITTAGGVHNFNSLNLTTDKGYTLTVGDNVENPTSSASVSVHFTQKLYYGNNSNTSINSAQILALANNYLTDSRFGTITVDGGGNYLYIAYPVAYGAAQIWVGGFLDTSWIQNTVSFTNASGYVENYYTYRSLYVQAGSGISIQIQ